MPLLALAFREIERIEQELGREIRFAYRHFPLVQIHPHAFAAAAAAEAAASQARFWEMHEPLYRRQKALEEADLRRYADQLGLDVRRFDDDRQGMAASMLNALAS
jgi:protein-disulfide isomerase